MAPVSVSLLLVSVVRRDGMHMPPASAALTLRTSQREARHLAEWIGLVLASS